MKGSRDNRSSRRSTRNQRAATETVNGGASEGFASEGFASEGSIEAQCPGCDKIYTLHRSRLGKDGRCSCGTVFPIRDSRRERSVEMEAPPPRSAQAKRWIEPEENEAPVAERTVRRHTPEADDRHAQDEQRPDSETGLTEVRVGCIGRGHAGKTALLRALGERSVGDFLPSGLHVDAADPRAVAQMIRESEQAQRLLHQFGLPPTLEATQIRYFLYEGAEPRVVYKMREVIGQVLTHTLPDSAADQQARYKSYLRSLVDTHVLWAMVPCPAVNPTPHDRRRYANDLRITLAYLREALRLRALEEPVALALVLSKMDVLFASAEEARMALTDQVLRDSFGPLVHLVEQSARIGDAVIIPVTIFGFGNAVLRDDGDGRHGAPPDMEDEPFAAEPIWLLREGASVDPYNLDTLFLWTLLAGLLGQADSAPPDETETAQLCRTLAEDLRTIDPWMLTLKEGDASKWLAVEPQLASGR